LRNLVEIKGDPLEQNGSPVWPRDNFAICAPNCEMKCVISTCATSAQAKNFSRSSCLAKLIKRKGTGRKASCQMVEVLEIVNRKR
jgi:hypothetical protein